MKVLVDASISRNAFPDFLVVDHVSALSNIAGNPEVIVFGKLKDQDTDILKFAPGIVKKSTCAVYICDQKNVSLPLKQLVESVEGYYNTDTFYLSSESALKGFLDEPFSSQKLEGTGLVEIFSTFENLPKGEILNPNSIALLIDSGVKLSNEVERFERERKENAVETIEFLSRFQELFSQLQKHNSEMIKQVEKFKEAAGSDYVLDIPGITNFPRFKVNQTKVKNLILIKSMGSVPYLVSYCLALAAYMSQRRNIKTKLIVLVPPSGLTSENYKEYPQVTERSHRSGADLNAPVVFVTYPTGSVLSNMVYTDGLYESIIVLDLLKNSKDHLFQVPKHVWFAVSGLKQVKRFKLTPSACFTGAHESKGLAFYIPTWKYPESATRREQLYFKNMSNEFDLMIRRQ